MPLQQLTSQARGCVAVQQLEQAEAICGRGCQWHCAASQRPDGMQKADMMLVNLVLTEEHCQAASLLCAVSTSAAWSVHCLLALF